MLRKKHINFKVQAYEKVIDGFNLTLCHRSDHIHLYAWLTIPLNNGESQLTKMIRRFLIQLTVEM